MKIHVIQVRTACPLNPWTQHADVIRRFLVIDYDVSDSRDTRLVPTFRNIKKIRTVLTQLRFSPGTSQSHTPQTETLGFLSRYTDNRPWPIWGFSDTHVGQAWTG